VVKKGDLKIAISTNGKSPTLAKRMREFLEAALPDTTQELLDNLGQIRARIEGDFQAKLKALNEVTAGFLKP
jgi:siroheme synthase (precorrin-2 oxidase/ferrochelatase)